MNPSKRPLTGLGLPLSYDEKHFLGEEIVLEVSGVSKDFGTFRAVNKVSFKAQRGEVLGFIGPNGAGKTTTIRVITGLLDPTEGDASICGFSICHQALEARRNFGHTPENAPLYEEMFVREFLAFVGRMREIKKEDLPGHIDRVLSMCALREVEFQKIETLSKGQKRRVSLAQGLIHDPPVLILDEPTDGLDPNQKYAVRELIKTLAKDKCILISTHILEEVEEICHKCIIIGRGEKLFEGTPGELAAKSDKGRMQDVFRAITMGEAVPGVVL